MTTLSKPNSAFLPGDIFASPISFDKRAVLFVYVFHKTSKDKVTYYGSSLSYEFYRVIVGSRRVIEQHFPSGNLHNNFVYEIE